MADYLLLKRLMEMGNALRYTETNCIHSNLMSLCLLKNEYISKINLKYIYYYLISINNHINTTYNKGSCNQSLDCKNISRMKIPIIPKDKQDNLMIQITEVEDIIKRWNKDIENYSFKKSCIISSFYTIQFISPKKRQTLINKIFKELNWGGAFFFVEKVRGSDARFQDILNQTYIDYKLSKGYSPNEIISKSRSLKGILEPFSTKGNIDLLKRAGFKDIITIFLKCFVSSNEFYFFL